MAPQVHLNLGGRSCVGDSLPGLHEEADRFSPEG